MTTLVPADDWPVYAVEEVGDGDTQTVVADCGADSLRRLALRLVVVDAPEMKDRDPAVRVRAAEAREASLDWITERLWNHGRDLRWTAPSSPELVIPGALRVTLQRRPSGAYLTTFGRWMADLYDPRTGESLSSHLLVTGHAVVWGSRPAAARLVGGEAWQGDWRPGSTGLPREWDED